MSLTWLTAYAFIVAGILISVVLPILRSLLPKPPSTAGGAAVSNPVNVYLIVGGFSLLTALLVLAFAGETVKTWQWYNALLAGYAWDSTLQKIVRT